MTTKTANPGRCFSAHESARRRGLDGVPLATFGQRLLGFVVDLLLIVVLWAPLELGWRALVLKEEALHVHWDFHEFGNIIVMVAYCGLFNYAGNGRRLGKWVARTRTVSLTRERME